MLRASTTNYHLQTLMKIPNPKLKLEPTIFKKIGSILVLQTIKNWTQFWFLIKHPTKKIYLGWFPANSSNLA
jgi:hypothetical protein